MSFCQSECWLSVCHLSATCMFSEFFCLPYLLPVCLPAICSLPCLLYGCLLSTVCPQFVFCFYSVCRCPSSSIPVCLLNVSLVYVCLSYVCLLACNLLYHLSDFWLSAIFCLSSTSLSVCWMSVCCMSVCLPAVFCILCLIFDCLSTFCLLFLFSVPLTLSACSLCCLLSDIYLSVCYLLFACSLCCLLSVRCLSSPHCIGSLYAVCLCAVFYGVESLIIWNVFKKYSIYFSC